MSADPAPAHAAPGLRTLSIDIGGSHVKAGLLDPAGTLIGVFARVPTPRPASPDAVMSSLTGMLGTLGDADRVSAGFPGVVRDGVVLTAPNLGTPAWQGYRLAEALTRLAGKPARVLNDASVHGLGVIAGRGLEAVITLGTGMGFALFQDGALAPHLELGRHSAHGGKMYDQWIGNAERQRIGKKRWNRRMAKVIDALHTLINYDTLLIGGGNTKFLTLELQPGVRLVPSQAGITGGVRLWDAAGPH